MANYKIEETDDGMLVVEFEKQGMKFTEGQIYITKYYYHPNSGNLELVTYDGDNPVIYTEEGEHFTGMKNPVISEGMFSVKLPQDFVEELISKLEESSVP